MLSTKTSIRFAFCIIVSLNFGFTVWHFCRTLKSLQTLEQPRQTEYSYVGSDYPLEYPIGELETVAMSLHESVHFAINATDEMADMEWETLAGNPKGYGRARLGPEHRIFVVTFHHQIHCLHQIQMGLVARDDPSANPHHLRHCFNYLRQTFLCAAADTLEKGDFIEKDYDNDRLGDDLVCHDWERVYDVLDDNYARWLEWSSRWN